MPVSLRTRDIARDGQMGPLILAIDDPRVLCLCVRGCELSLETVPGLIIVARDFRRCISIFTDADALIPHVGKALILIIHFNFPISAHRSSSLCSILSKPWTQMSTLVPRGSCVGFIAHDVRHSRSSSTFIEWYLLTFSRFTRQKITTQKSAI